MKSSLNIVGTGLDRFPLPLVGFAAFSGTGKTTLLLELIPLFKRRGLRVAVIKHAHHSLEPDQPSKDSMRLREAGASRMLVASRHRAVLFNEYPERSEEPTLAETLEILPLTEVDLVLVEGFKREAIPKIEGSYWVLRSCKICDAHMFG